jgi:transcriptional regulator with XRE-family HTH domain
MGAATVAARILPEIMIRRLAERIDPPSDPRLDLRDEVARALRRARGRRSQAQWVAVLAGSLGRVIDASQWSRYETGTIEPPAAVLVAAARAAGISLAALMEEPQPSPRELADKLDQLLQAVERRPKPPR